MKRITGALLGFVLALMLGTALSQIIQRPRNPQNGLSPGLTYFMAGSEPTEGPDGEIAVRFNRNAPPEFVVYSIANGNWIAWDELALNINFGATPSFTTAAIQINDQNAIVWTGATTEGQLVANARVYASNVAGGGYIVSLDTNAGLGGELSWQVAADLAVVGAAQTVAPASTSIEIGAGAAASVSVIIPQLASANGQLITFHCKDANITFNDSDAAGAANTINLAGVATNFVCSSDDTLTVSFIPNPGSGNARWMEVSRAVN